MNEHERELLRTADSMVNEGHARYIDAELDRPALVKNLSGRERCRHCLDAGLALVSRSLLPPVALNPKPIGSIEEYGPCPFCEIGYREEYGASNESTGVPAPWSKTSFWQGRSPDVAALEPQNPGPVLTGPQAAARLAGLRERMGWITQPMPDGLDKTDVAGEDQNLPEGGRNEA